MSFICLITSPEVIQVDGAVDKGTGAVAGQVESNSAEVSDTRAYRSFSLKI